MKVLAVLDPNLTLCHTTVLGKSNVNDNGQNIIPLSLWMHVNPCEPMENAWFVCRI